MGFLSSLFGLGRMNVIPIGNAFMHMRVIASVVIMLIGLGPALAQQSAFNFAIGSQSIFNIEPKVTASLQPGSSVQYDPTQVYPYTLSIKTPFITQTMNGPNADPSILLSVQSQSLTHSNFGLWAQGTFGANVGLAAAYGAGIPTEPHRLPKKVETYVGTILFDSLGAYTSAPPRCYHCVGIVSMTIDFGKSKVVYSISFGSGVGTLTGAGTLSGNTFSSILSGILDPPGFHNPVSVAGALSGLIYGPSGTEVAGSYEAFGGIPGDTSFAGVQGAFGAQIPKHKQ
jgi:hypothetical protein